MTKESFSLIAFPASHIPEISITGEISLQNNVVTLHYSLAGKIEDIFLPLTALNPSRKDELWKTTCFELFLAIKGLPQYWEFNMSPSGDWNVYRMDAYRRIGFRKETSIQRLPFEVRAEEGMFTLDAVVDLDAVIPQSPLFEIGITAIIQSSDGNETYWALAHPGPIADFHLRESFTLEMSEQTRLAQQSALDG